MKASAWRRSAGLALFLVALLACAIGWAVLRPSRAAKAPVQALGTGPPAGETLAEANRLEAPLGVASDTPVETTHSETMPRVGDNVPIPSSTEQTPALSRAGQPQQTAEDTQEAQGEHGAAVPAPEADYAVATEDSNYDLRKRYGTQTLECARYISRALTLYFDGSFQEAKAELKRALAKEPRCQFALYWLAHTQTDLGDIDSALAAYREVVSVAEATASIAYPANVSVDAAVNAGLMCGHLGRYAESADLLARALLLDPKDQHGFAWKARRNLALSLYNQGDYASAAMNASIGREANPDRVEEKMVRDFDELARGANPITTRILPLSSSHHDRPDRQRVPALELPALDCPEPLVLLLSDPLGEWLLAIITCCYCGTENPAFCGATKWTVALSGPRWGAGRCSYHLQGHRVGPPALLPSRLPQAS